MAIKTFPEMALAISAFSSYSSLFPTTNHMGSLKVSYNCHLVYFFAFTLPWIPFPVLLFFSFNPHRRTYSLIVREREKGRERDEKNWWIASHIAPQPRLNPQSRYVPWPGIETMSFQCSGQFSNKPKPHRPELCSCCKPSSLWCNHSVLFHLHSNLVLSLYTHWVIRCLFSSTLQFCKHLLQYVSMTVNFLKGGTVC